MKRLAKSVVFACVAALGLAAVPARAAVEVGDKPALKFKSVDGASVDLQKLKGKLVVVDFWATWCGPCMQLAGEMVELNQAYADKGVQMIGVSLDSDKAKLLSVAKKENFTWPQYFDGLGWGNKIWKEWGEGGIPFTVLLGPDGSVLWKGHAAQLRDELEKALKSHPPQLVDPKVLAEAKEALASVDGKVKAGDMTAAIKLLAKVPEGAKADAEFASQMVDVRKVLEQEADKMLAEVDPLVAKGDNVAAVARLKDLARGLAGLPVADKARKQLAALTAKPEVKAQIEAAERLARADEALAAGLKLKAEKKDELAYGRLRGVARDFPDTAAARAAAAALKDYEKDAAFVRRVNEKEFGVKAKAALSMARSYKQAKRTDLARKKFQSVIDDFAGTSYADEAKRELASMAK